LEDGGNFFNGKLLGIIQRGLLPCRLKLDEVRGVVNDNIMDNLKIVDGSQYIQVHPTFLYESMWNQGVFILIMIFRKRKKFDGEVFLWYILV
jgi:phosphatidylglycerol:prolipoprotein diacylglycerol transferase